MINIMLSAFSFYDLFISVEMRLLTFSVFSLLSSVSVHNAASLFPLLLLILLQLLQTDVLSHHLQRNLIYLDSQVRAASLLPELLHY